MLTEVELSASGSEGLTKQSFIMGEMFSINQNSMDILSAPTTAATK